MRLNWSNLSGEWNPQFFREFRGRMTPRNVGLTLAITVVSQILLLMYFSGFLPNDKATMDRYCTGSLKDYGTYHQCLKDALGQTLVNWPLWWQDIFTFISWSIPFILLMGGVYLLISDISKEERRGTLNFVRLSPQSCQSIMGGKLLGVPLLPYLGLAAIIPLHLYAALQAKVSVGIVLSVYLLTIAAASVFFSASILMALLGMSQAWVGLVVVCMSYFIGFNIWMQFSYSYSGTSGLKWFYLPIGENWALGQALILTSCAVATFWFWQAINRCFRNPNITILSKQQSYWLNACAQVFLLGFVFRDYKSTYDTPAQDLYFLCAVNLFWFTLLAAVLLPHRQTLLDWARYRRDRSAGKKSIWTAELIQDLIQGEKSPAVLAIAINLGLTGLVYAIWILSWPAPQSLDQYSSDLTKFQALIGLLLNLTVMLIYATIAQWLLLARSPKRVVVMTATILGLVFIPLFVLGFMNIRPDESPLPWLLTAFPIAIVRKAEAIAMVMGFLGQLTVLTLFNVRLHRQLRQVGESEFKALTENRQLLAGRR